MIDKEVRALLPAWAACALAIVASRWQIEPFRYLGVPAYFVGTAGLGAWVMGHEYSHGTLASLLSIPVPRHRIWTAKLVVVAPLLAALAALGAFFVPVEFGDQKFGVALFVL
ncbi:MAG TPA: ABC transporter permease, partial [Vicinamibacterales bacterium]|nr:ABC transporter permease [Vicinamibacterales bacterium]